MEFIQTLAGIDTKLFLTLNGVHNSFFDFIMYWISQVWVWAPLYLGVLYFIIRKFKSPQVFWMILILVLALVLSDQISSLIKNAVLRWRPSRDSSLQGLVHTVNEYVGGRYGFVSAHSANTLSFALLTSFFFKNRIYTSLIFIWSISVSYSRIYLGVHYPGDVLGGWILGLSVAFLLYFIYLKIGVKKFLRK